MQADATKLQGLCGKRRMPEGEGSSVDTPSKFPKLHNESILLSHNTDEFFFADASALPANVFPDLLLQEGVNHSNAQNSGNTETTFCGGDVPSPCWDCFSPDGISQTSLNEDNSDYYYYTFGRSNYDNWGSALDDNNFCANGNNDWIYQSEVNSNPNAARFTMNQPEVHPNSVQLACYENCETNKDLDSTNMEPGLHEFVCENNGIHVDNDEPDSDEPDIPQPQSES